MAIRHTAVYEQAIATEIPQDLILHCTRQDLLWVNRANTHSHDTPSDDYIDL